MNKLKPNKKPHKSNHEKQLSEDKKNNIIGGIAVILTFTMAILMLSQTLNGSTTMRAMYPKNFIPFWSQERKGYETTLLNTQQIVRIQPIFDPKVDDPDHKDIICLYVYLADGKMIQVEEDFEEFYNRIRVSQAR